METNSLRGVMLVLGVSCRAGMCGACTKVRRCQANGWSNRRRKDCGWRMIFRLIGMGHKSSSNRHLALAVLMW
ncbi:hypothetical protein BGZ61DRAFT_81798 [Ilyonectria robusta]|uniref:uncharacterized protein n=1 Tax=Ilyonectria robusta TaxID=1079257 RepID=UPI001E8EA4DF|nr:uncharacterized protein BGZ61DRAFT_81798 [Ilyonectria robusta]KAH8735585.1 hypothetical protein BGZ61DRAFT_81798 [Ilyonectria robusta]